MAEACLEKPVDILTRYFTPAVSLLPPGPDTKTLSDHAHVYYQFAVFAERQYQDLLNSPDTLRYKLYMDRKQKELTKRKQIVQETQGTQGHANAANLLRKTQSILREDQERYHQQTRVLSSFREQAVDMFSRCMSVSDEFDDESIMRFISLWFANFEESSIYTNLRDAVKRIASRKFVFLAHQISARLSKEDAAVPETQVTPTQQVAATQLREGQYILRNLVLCMCREHPFHSLYQVYCLRPSNDRGGSQNRRQSGRVEAASQADREAAASEIFAILREEEGIRDRVMAVERLCDASLQWAKYPIKKEYSGNKRKKGPQPVPDTLLLRRIQNLRVPVSTAHTPLDSSMEYADCAWVVRYETTYQTAGGVNLPKISVCLGSDGISYKQLVRNSFNFHRPI
jgi:serine-protein kinase ATM